MQTFLQDIRYGLRMIVKARAFTVIALLALALGICANTTIFSFINGLVLRPLTGVKDPDRLVAVYTSDYSSGLYGESSYPDFVDFRSQADAFEDLAAHEAALLNLSSEGDGAERLRGHYVTSNYFTILGVTAKLGRTLQVSDDTPSASPAVVISDEFWQSRFNSDPNIVGRTLKLNTQSYTIVGVTESSFRGLRLGLPPQFWLSMPAQEEFTSRERGGRSIDIVGRLKPGVTLEQAQGQLTTIGARLAQAYPDTNRGIFGRPDEPRPITVVREGRLGPEGRQGVWRISILLFAVVGLVLLIACANVANLLLARASVRRREIAVRLAVGASRGRLIRQLLTESVLLGLMGGALGLLLTQWTARALPSFFPESAAQGLDFIFDWRVLVFTFAVSVLTGLVFGLVPALQTTRPDLVSSLKDDAIGTSNQRFRRLGLRDSLVISQLALSLVLLISAALFVRSLRHAVNFDPGFASQSLVTAALDTRAARFNREQGQAFYQQMVERISKVPGVSDATFTVVIPISGGGQRRNAVIEGYQPQPSEDMELNTNVIGEAFFRTMGIPIVRGRAFGPEDRPGGPGVAIVNEEFARRYFNGDALGKRVQVESDSGYLEIVGVARTAKYRNLREEPLPFIYLPLSQNYQPDMTLMVRTERDPASLLGTLRNEMNGVNKAVAVFSVQMMSETIADQLAVDRMIAVLLSVFGGAALLLAAIGIYGVMGYAVAQRTREIGIRVALGAERGDIMKLIVRRGLVLTVIGATIGLALAFALTRALKSLLFGVSATDPLTFSAVATLLVAVAMLACYFPARRATTVDPIVALRNE
ncbi:MAG TPA: ABC transporter permease [Pyrinomonadaceae bacterium]|nr:ABC transporter permease [Pyrinomonadaceae bacterium]